GARPKAVAARKPARGARPGFSPGSAEAVAAADRTARGLDAEAAAAALEDLAAGQIGAPDRLAAAAADRTGHAARPVAAVAAPPDRRVLALVGPRRLHPCVRAAGPAGLCALRDGRRPQAGRPVTCPLRGKKGARRRPFHSDPRRSAGIVHLVL